MTIEEKVNAIVDEKFPTYSFVFEDWQTADKVIDKVDLPAIIFILPVSGTLEYGTYGRVKDSENCAIAFVDKVTKVANGSDNASVYNAMKTAARAFIKAINESGYFEPLTGDVQYNLIYEELSSIVTGVMLSLELKQLVGVCD